MNSLIEGKMKKMIDKTDFVFLQIKHKTFMHATNLQRAEKC